MSMVEFPGANQHINGRSMLFRAILSCTSVTAFMLQVAAFAVYYGALADRFTSNLFANTSQALQELQFGWWASYFIGGLIMIGPMDYYVGLSMVNPNYDLLISIMGIYFVSSIFIGLNMRHYHPIGGFLLGFCTMAFFNIVIYLMLTQFGNLLTNYGVDAVTVDTFQSLISSVLAGIYGESPASFLFRGIFINGTIMGVFGSFWTAVFMPAKPTLQDLVVKVKCPSGKGVCVVPPPKKIFNGTY